MKKQFIVAFVGSLFTTFSATALHAQRHAAAPSIPSTHEVSSTAPNTAAPDVLINNPVDATAIPLERVNSKVARQFVKFYKDAQNVQWYKNGNTYIAMFDQDGMKSHAAFGEHGYWYYDVRFGTENDLPANVRKVIKSNYVDYAIGQVAEANIGDQKAWIVNLEDQTHLVQVRVIDGALDELARYDTHLPEKTKKGRIVIPQ